MTDRQAQGSVQVTEAYVDPKYARPFVDVNELRDEPVPHRYVHGGFEESDARVLHLFPAGRGLRGALFP